jgi:hypothetical protein
MLPVLLAGPGVPDTLEKVERLRMQPIEDAAAARYQSLIKPIQPPFILIRCITTSLTFGCLSGYCSAEAAYA